MGSQNSTNIHGCKLQNNYNILSVFGSGLKKSVVKTALKHILLKCFSDYKSQHISTIENLEKNTKSHL